MSSEVRQQQSNGADRRAFGRRPTNMHAVAIVPGRSPIHCTVRDVSLGGALLDFGSPTPLPARLRLRWEAHDIEARCEVRHVDGGRVGVLFLCDAGPKILAIGAAETREAAQPLATLAPVSARAEPSDVAAKSRADMTTLLQRFRAKVPRDA